MIKGLKFCLMLWALLWILPVNAEKVDPNHVKHGGYGYCISSTSDVTLWWSEAAYKVMKDAPVPVKKKKETVEFKVDEGPRAGSTIEGLAKLRAINPNGVVTAGNASSINDGAAAIVVMSEEKAKELKFIEEEKSKLTEKEIKLANITTNR